MEKLSPKLSVVFSAIFVVALTRLIPHPPNMTALGAVAIFGGAVISNSRLAILIPLVALFLSDLIINNVVYHAYYDSFVFFGGSAGWIYASFILMAVVSHYVIKNINATNVALATVISTLLFFFITNTGVWTSSPMYSKDISGWFLAIEAGLPFLLNSLIANAIVVPLLFWGYSKALERKVEWLFIKK